MPEKQTIWPDFISSNFSWNHKIDEIATAATSTDNLPFYLLGTAGRYWTMWIFCFCSVPPLLKNELSNVYFNNFLDMWPVLAARCKCSLSCSKSTSLSVWTVHCVTASTCKWAVCTCAMLNRGCALCERKIRHSVTCKYSWLTALPFNMCVVSLSGNVAVPKRDAWKFLWLLN